MNTRSITSGLVTLSILTLAPIFAAPNKAPTAQLGAPVVVGGYQIQPPKGYTRKTQPGPSGSALEAWVGEHRADKTRPFLMLVTLRPVSEEDKHYQLKDVAVKMLSFVHQHRTHWKQSTFETVTMNGLTFIKVSWQGVDVERGRAMHGFSWVTQDHGLFFQISSQDVDPYSKTTLPIAEAAARTFKRH